MAARCTRSGRWHPSSSAGPCGAAAMGATSRTTGDPIGIGSHDRSVSTGGGTAGLDYQLSPYTVVGFALGGGGTNWSIAQGLGSGHSDVFQAGVYAITHFRPAYLAPSFSY